MSHQEDQPRQLTEKEQRFAHEQAEQGRQFGREGTSETYSNQGPKGGYIDDATVTNDQDPLADDVVDRQNYGYQDQFGDVDGQDPYNYLDEAEIEDTSLDEQEGLYGLAEPLAQAGDRSRQGSDKDSVGTESSQDQKGYQQ